MTIEIGKFRHALMGWWIVILVILGMNIPSYADSYEITGYDIHIELQSDGSALVTERITYDFQGSFNGVYYNLDLSGSGGIEAVSVAVDSLAGLQFVQANDSEAYGTYQYSVSDGYAHFKVFERSIDTVKTFVYNYRMQDAVIVYSDIAEFNRKLIGTKWDVPIQNVTAEVVLPEKTSSDRVYVFSHGPLTGESALRDGGTTEFRVDRVPMGEFFEAHVLFPIEIVPEAEHKEARAVLQSILDQEKQLAEEANASRDKAKKDLASAQLRRTVGIRLLPVFFVFWLLGLIWNYKRFGRPPKGTFDGRYFREIPDDYAPTDLYYLMNHEGSPTFKEISATLMDLVRRNLLKLEMKSYLKKGFLRTSAETDFMFSQPEEGIDKTSITETEWFLVDWLFSEAGNGNEFSLQDMKDYFSSMRSGDGAEQKIRAWQKSARDQARQGGFFVERTGKYIFSGIAPALILIISGLVLTFFFTFWGVILFVLAFLSLIHFGRQKHFTPYGWDQYMKWKAFKRFIRDFSRIEDAVIPSIAIWEHYLVFGITLGVAKKVIQAFPKQLYRENVQNYTTSTYVLTRALASSEGNIDSLESHFHEFNNHMEEVAKVANSHSSSGSGSGGGSSGGSSGGGGGGSGGGAF